MGEENGADAFDAGRHSRYNLGGSSRFAYSLPAMHMDSSSQPSQRANRGVMLAVCLLLLAAVALVFAQSLRHEFVYDDEDYIQQNPHVTEGLKSAEMTWVATHRHHGHWHPLTWISHMLDCQVYGLKPWGHHLTNVLIHASTAIGLFLLLHRLTGQLWPSAFMAALFSLHPLRVESVAWVSERKGLLSGLFFVLALSAYVRYATRPFSIFRYALVALLFALGLMSKAMVATLPGVLLLLDYWPLRRMDDAARRGKVRWLILEKLPLIVLMCVSLAVAFWAQGDVMIPIEQMSFSTRAVNSMVAYVAYIGQFLWPRNLACFYPHPGSSLQLWRGLAALAILVATTLAALRWRKTCPAFLVGWLWYLGMLLPVIGFVQAGEQAMADRYTYLPHIGLGLAATGLLQFHIRRFHIGFWPASLAALWLAVLACATWQQTVTWRNSETLWHDTLQSTTRNWLAENNYGAALSIGGHREEAIEHYRRSLEIRPDFIDADSNLRMDLAECGRIDEALQDWENHLPLKSSDAVMHYRFGIASLQRGRLLEAAICFRRAIELRPDFASAHNSLAIAMAQKGYMKAAISEWQKTLAIEPQNESAQKNLKQALEQLPTGPMP